MDDLNIVVAANLRRLREERKLSLEQVARLSGVSKSMLGQIERGATSPTVSTVWKISNGLKVSFTELMNRPERDVEVVRREDAGPLEEDGGKYRAYPLFPFSKDRRFEIYSIELDPGARLEAEPHPPGTQEFVTVFSGTIVVEVNGGEFTVKEGGAIRFQADQPHGYRSTGNKLCRVSMVIAYR